MSDPAAQHRIAMWSPPRARSTMLMRVFEALGCAVLDEPFYAYWLGALERRHDPGFVATIANHETDWRRIVEQVLGPIPDGRSWYYQKHMAIHMLDEVDLGWMGSVRNCFLIRDPAAVIVSMSDFRGLTPRNDREVEAAARLAGIPQLRRLFDRACDLEQGPPPVIDADDILRAPAAVLTRFCAAIGMDFDPARPIKWAPGRHAGDGAWAEAWYGKVFATTGLEPFNPGPAEVPPGLLPVVEYCRPTYDYIARFCLR